MTTKTIKEILKEELQKQNIGKADGYIYDVETERNGQKYALSFDDSTIAYRTEYDYISYSWDTITDFAIDDCTIQLYGESANHCISLSFNYI